MAKVNKFRAARKIIKSLGGGTSIYTACQAAQISPMTFWRWRNENPKFGAFIRGVIDARTQIVEDSLYQNALKGNVTAQIFWLKNKAGWKDSPAVAVSSGPNISTPHAVIFSAIKEECITTPFKGEDAEMVQKLRDRLKEKGIE